MVWVYRAVLRLLSYSLCSCHDVMWLRCYVVWYLLYVVSSLRDVVSSLRDVVSTFSSWPHLHAKLLFPGLLAITNWLDRFLDGSQLLLFPGC